MAERFSRAPDWRRDPRPRHARSALTRGWECIKSSRCCRTRPRAKPHLVERSLREGAPPTARLTAGTSTSRARWSEAAFGSGGHPAGPTDNLPGPDVQVEIGEPPQVDVRGGSPGLSGLEMHPLPSRQTGGPTHGALDVELRGVDAGAFAGIRNLDADYEAAVLEASVEMLVPEGGYLRPCPNRNSGSYPSRANQR